MRRKQLADHRLNWRDEHMPVLRMVRFGNDDNWQLGEIAPEVVQKYYAAKLEVDRSPEWRDDSTYNMRVKK